MFCESQQYRIAVALQKPVPLHLSTQEIKVSIQFLIIDCKYPYIIRKYLSIFHIWITNIMTYFNITTFLHKQSSHDVSLLMLRGKINRDDGY